MSHRTVITLTLSSILSIILVPINIHNAQAQNIFCSYFPSFCGSSDRGGGERGPNWAPLSPKFSALMREGYEAYQRGDYDTAASRFSEAESLAKSKRDNEGRAIAIFEQGEVHLATGKRGDAVRSFKKAEYLLDQEVQEIKDEENKIRLRLGQIRRVPPSRRIRLNPTVDDSLSSGDSAYKRGDYKGAAKYFSHAANVAKEDNDIERLAIAKAGLGDVYLATGDRESAIRSFEDAEKLLHQDAQEIGDETNKIRLRLRQINRRDRPAPPRDRPAPQQ